jgi:aryl-alcohol dehydrogenase-like predicted oxidoreductase
VGLVLGGAFGQGWTAELVENRREEMQQMIETGEYRDRIDESVARKLLAFYDLADDLGMSMPEMTVRFVMANDDIHTHAPGARRVAHIEENIRAAKAGPLPPDATQRVLDIAQAKD